MHSSKYKRGRKIRSVGDFEKSNCDMFYVNYGKEILRHRKFLENLQFRILKRQIELGYMREAIKENEDA